MPGVYIREGISCTEFGEILEEELLLRHPRGEIGEIVDAEMLSILESYLGGMQSGNVMGNLVGVHESGE